MHHMKYASVIVTIALLSVTAFAGENLVKDPGFETFKLNKEKGYYSATEDSPWTESAPTPGSIVFDGSKWKAPKAMKEERKRGFSPGATGFVGMKPGENSGVLKFTQDIVAPELFAENGRYEAWVWLGGAGKDEGCKNGGDRKDEMGGWTATFYSTDDPASWNDNTKIETHKEIYDFFGEPESFVQISGQGSIPPNAKGVRLMFEARTWYPATGPGQFDTAVALDDAHFAVLDHPNLLYNGNFELDENPIDFKGWKRPARYPFPDNSLTPINVLDVYRNQGYYTDGWDHNFDHGYFLPFMGDRMSYGYITFLRGWQEAAYSFSQTVDFVQKDETPLTWMFYWVQDTQKPGDAWQLREHGGQIESVLQYFKGDKEIGSDKFTTNWPSPSAIENHCRYDLNGHKAYNPRYRVVPPRGTETIEANVYIKVRHPWAEGRSHVAFAVDDFYLGVANPD